MFTVNRPTNPVMATFFSAVLLTTAGNAQQLGRELSSEEVGALTQHVFPDGTGLPAGSGTTVEGAKLFGEYCAQCHGGEGQGGAAMELVGDRSLLATEYPDKGVGVYWPYAPALFEYIQRSMPPNAPYSFTNNELYAIVARGLELNELIADGETLDAARLATIKMPNRDGFFSRLK